MASPNCENKYITLLDLARQSKIITGDTACFAGKIQAGLPFSGYPTGVDIETMGSIGVIPWPSSGSTAVFSSNTVTTVFDVANPLSPFFPTFSGITGTSWTNPIFSAHTSGLTLPITLFTADTQEVGPFWFPTETGMTGDHVITTQVTGYTLIYSFEDLSSPQSGPPLDPYVIFSGITSVVIQGWSAGTLDYKGPIDYLRSREDATIDNRLTTKKLRVTGGASASTIGHVLTQIDELGNAGWRASSGASADTNTFVVSGLLDGSDDLILTYNTAGTVPAIDLSNLRFTGNTSGDCITDLFITNLHGCSPITVHDNLIFDGCDVLTGISETMVFGRNLTLSGVTHLNTFANIMLGGEDNVISTPFGFFVNSSGILGGFGNKIEGRSTAVFIMGADDSTVTSSSVNNSLILGGRDHIINGGINNSLILGGTNITATDDDTVYVPNLNIGTIGSGSPSINLGLDSSGNVVTGTTFTGNTSGDCITDLYTTNIHSCSPLNINPLDEGNVYFGSTSGVSIDVLNSRVGVGVDTPEEKLHVMDGDIKVDNTGLFYTDVARTIGAFIAVSGGTDELVQVGAQIPGSEGISIGSRGSTAPSTGPLDSSGYGKNSDGFIYSSAAQNGLNIISQDGGATKEDYIRFYAGKDAGSPADMFISGTSSPSSSFIGMGTETPTEKLHVVGSIRMVDGTEQVGYVLTSDADGVGSWQAASGGGSSGFSWSDPVVKTGNTSGTCIDQLFVSIISGCSPVTIGSSINLVGALGTPGLIYAQPSGGMISGDINTSYGGHGFTDSGSPRVINKDGDESMALCIDHPYLGAMDYKNSGGRDEIFKFGVTTSAGTTGLTTSFGTGESMGMILNSDSSKIASGVTRSVIIGGSNITATTSDTVYVPNLNIGTVGGSTPINNLGIDGDGNVVAGNGGINPYNNVGSASTLTWDVSGTSTNYEITLTANTELTMTNVRNGDYGTLIIHQDNSGSRELTFAGGTNYVVNGGGGAPTLTTDAFAIDILSFTYNGDSFFWTVGNDYLA